MMFVKKDTNVSLYNKYSSVCKSQVIYGQYDIVFKNETWMIIIELKHLFNHML